MSASATQGGHKNNYAFVCLNISDILLIHKYTQHTHLKVQFKFVYIFFHIMLNICRQLEFLIS